MSVRKSELPKLYEWIEEQNLLRQYDLLTNVDALAQYLERLLADQLNEA